MGYGADAYGITECGKQAEIPPPPVFNKITQTYLERINQQIEAAHNNNVATENLVRAISRIGPEPPSDVKETAENLPQPMTPIEHALVGILDALRTLNIRHVAINKNIQI